jgi:bile acid-coenzyme A ligase
MRTSFVDHYRRLVAQAPSAPAVTFGNTTLDRAALLRRGEALARYFLSLGVAEGDYVPLVLPNGNEMVVATMACWLAGAVPQPLSPKIARVELDAILELTSPRLVVTDLEGLGTQVVPASVEVADPGGEVPARVSPYWKAPTSGGSTGRPKVIVAAQPAVWEEVSAFADLLAVTGRTSLITAPMSHNGPFICALLTILSGGHAVIMGRFDAEETLRAIERHRAEWVYAVPTIMGRILKLEESTRLSYDLSSLQALMHMAAPCPPAVKTAFIDWLGPKRVLELYTGTEVQAVCVLDGGEWLAHPGSVGRALIGELSIRDDDGSVLPAGEIGHVYLRRGPGVPSPYFYLGATPKALEDGWETLGDLGHLDEDGYLYLADRDTDMILVGGSNVYPAEVEAALLEHPLVTDACVIGLPHDDLGAAAHALLRVTEPLPEEDLRHFVAGRLTSYKQPYSYEFVQNPLRDDAGKVRRSALRTERLRNIAAG